LHVVDSVNTAIIKVNKIALDDTAVKIFYDKQSKRLSVTIY